MNRCDGSSAVACAWQSHYSNLTDCYDHQEPNSLYIVINVSFGSALAYRLIFSGSSQRLELVEILPPAISSTITWKGQRLFPSNGPTDAQKALNSKFGPTYPPSPHPKFPDELVLSYPGVVFAFHRDNASSRSSALPTSTTRQAGSKIAEDRCPLTRLVVSRHDPSANHATAYPDIAKLEQSQDPYPIAEGDVSYADIEVCYSNSIANGNWTEK